MSIFRKREQSFGAPRTVEEVLRVAEQRAMEAARVAFIETMTIPAPKPSNEKMLSFYRTYRDMPGVIKFPEDEALLQDSSPEAAA